MSVNYHAYQNRGVLFSECEAIYEQWHQAYSNYDPTRIAGILHLDRDEKYLYLTYFETLYRVRLKDGFLEKKKPEWTDKIYVNEAMVICRLLKDTKDLPIVSGVWVPNDSLDGVVSRNPAAKDPLLIPFAKRWSGKTKKLEEICEKLGGKKLTKGDVSYEFLPFWFMPVQLIFWDADEDLPAQANIMVDRNITDFIHFEAIGCVISDLLDQIESQTE